MLDFKEYMAREPEWIEGSGIKLAATVYRRDPKLWMVGVHGGHSESKRKGKRWAYLNRLAERHNWSFVAFDLRDEDGDSFPHMDATITQSLKDLDLVIKTLVPDDGRVVLFGHSRGAFVSFAWAATRQIRKAASCILVAPAWSSYARFLTRIKEVGVNEDTWRQVGEVTYMRWGKVQTRTWKEMEDARQWDRREWRLALEFTIPTLVIHSANDRVIHHDLSKAFGGFCESADVRIVQTGDHQFNGFEHWLMIAAEEFLMRKNIF